MEPVTELDERFSGPGASATPWVEVREALEAAETSVEQKAVNLRSNHNVVLTTGCNQWQTGLDVIVERVARRVTDDDKLRRLAEAWTTKWDGSWQFDAHDGAFHHDGGNGEAFVFEVTPTKVLSFAKHRFAATRYRF